MSPRMTKKARARTARSRRPSRAATADAYTITYRLDTGKRQAAAKHLYERSGYVEIPDYNGNTQASYWFEKELG